MVAHFASVRWECFALKRSLLICGPWTPAASRLAFIQYRIETNPIHLKSVQTCASLCKAGVKIFFMSSNVT